MAKQSKQSGVAAVYARALLELATPQGQGQAVADELADLKSLVGADPMFAAFLRDPAISRGERTALVNQVFQGKLSPLVMNFLLVANAHGRLGYIAAIADAYQAQLDKQQGRIDVGVTVAQPLDDALLEEVRQKVSTALGKDAQIHQHVDDSIIGGVVLSIEDRQIDGSIRSQLQTVRRNLAARAESAV